MASSAFLISVNKFSSMIGSLYVFYLFVESLKSSTLFSRLVSIFMFVTLNSLTMYFFLLRFLAVLSFGA